MQHNYYFYIGIFVNVIYNAFSFYQMDFINGMPVIQTSRKHRKHFDLLDVQVIRNREKSKPLFIFTSLIKCSLKVFLDLFFVRNFLWYILKLFFF